MDGLFNLAKMLFGVIIELANGLALVWNNVRFYCVKESSGSPTAYFYFDPYSCPSEKREGAWIDEVFARNRARSRDGATARLPVAHVVCNQAPPVGNKPSLMTFYEVKAVFHEFGHALQQMLTKEDEGLVAGIRGIEWDAVELPSQFMENWCYHRLNLLVLIWSYTQSTVPGGSESIYNVDHSVSQKTEVIPPLPEDRFLCGFMHIFSGEYAAGYYSYKWAEVLSADAFSAFEEAGLNDIKALKETGKKFRETVLALGGSKAPLDVFVNFQGREPSPEPLLRHNGLLAVSV